MISSDADVIYISGKFETYNGLHKQWEGVWGATVEIWDKDTFGDDKLKTIVIENPDGSFFTSVSNTDGEGGGQEIYLKLIASNNYVSVSPPLNPFDYWAQTDVAPEASNGETLVFNIKGRTDDEKSGAWHVLREIYRGANYKINNEKSVRDYVGKVSVEWPDDSGTYYSNGKIILLKGDRWDDEVILHEYGHFVMDQIYGYIPPTWQNHGFAQHTSQTSAWAEGWANFFQGAVRSNSSYYDGDIDPGAIFNLENTWTPSGEDVEGNIAKSLWDMFDNSKSGDDFNDDFQTSFSKIFNSFKDPETSYTGTGSNKMVDVIREFWENWFQLGYNSLQQMKRIFYYNGIDYGYNSQICVQVSMDKTTYSPSESATLNVMLKDENLNYVEGASVTYLIRNLDEVIIKSGSCFDKGNGKYEAKFNAPETTGSYTVEVTATKSGYADGFASTSFTVINPAEGHNIRLATLELSRNKAEPGDPVQIKCQIDNRGEYTEDVNVDIAISGPDYSFSPSTISVGSLKPSHTTGIKAIYTWNIPTNAKTGYYTIKVTAWSPSGDEDFSDNEKSTSVYVSTGEPPTYNAYYYEYRILEWNDNADYRKYGWPFKGAYGPVTFHNSYTGHDYTIAIPGVEEGKDGDFWIFIQRDDGALIETPNLDNNHKKSLSQYFEDNKLMVIFDFILYPSKDAYIKLGYPTTSASLNPYYQSGTVNEEITYSVDFPQVDYWWNPEVHKCSSADQPRIYEDEIIDWFDVVPDAGHNDFTITATPPQSGNYKFAIDSDGPIMSNGQYVGSYIVFGELRVNDFYDAKLSSITINPSQPKVGDEVIITNKVENIGSAPLTGIDVYTTIFDSEGKAVKSFHKTADAGDVSFSWDTSGLTSGDYTINSFISHSKDMDTSNNVLSKKIKLLPPPHLIVTASSDKTKYKLNEIVIINATVKESENQNEVSDALVKATITKPDDAKEIVVLSYSSGKYNVTYIPDQIGSYNVTVTASKVGYKTGETSFAFLVEDWLMSLDVIPNSWQMNVGEEKQFNATVYWASGKREDVTSKASWSTDNASVLENMGVENLERNLMVLQTLLLLTKGKVIAPP